MGTFALKNGSIFLALESPGGIYNPSQLECIAKLCDEKSIIAKLTEDQRVGIYIPEAELSAVAKRVNEVGLGLRHYQNGLHQPQTCIGELCTFAQQDALGLSVKITEALKDVETVSPLRIGINGCMRNCVPSHTLDISLIGDDGGYRMYIGGRTSGFPELSSFIAEDIPESDVPNLTKKILELYNKNVQDEESLGDVIERMGVSPFVDVLKPYSQDAAGGGADFSEPMEEESGESLGPEESLEIVETSEEAELEAPEIEIEETGETFIEEEGDVESAERKPFEKPVYRDENQEEVQIDDSGLLPEEKEEFEEEEFLEEAPSEEEVFEEKLASGVEEMESIPDDPDREKRRETLRIVEDTFRRKEAQGTELASSSWEVKSVDLSPQQELFISFDSGASININLDMMRNGERQLAVGDKTIHIFSSPLRVVVEVDELKLTIPRRAA
ncbi:MAG: hypothetical protein HYW48_07160 [Deltaproteobacteria bacterium]|nr:hypothetical protein [Deltaproteobacteria bacterium]